MQLLADRDRFYVDVYIFNTSALDSFFSIHSLVYGCRVTSEGIMFLIPDKRGFFQEVFSGKCQLIDCNI
jgi:hypothetical protein